MKISSVLLVTVTVMVLVSATATDAADLKQLISQVSSSDRGKALSAIDALGNLGQRASSAVSALTRALSSDDEEIAWHAARALGAIGPAAKSATGDLVRALDDDNAQLRAYAAYALGEIRDVPDAAVDRLVELAFDEEELVRRATLKSLLKIDPPPAKTMPMVERILAEGKPEMLMPALHTLAEQGEAAVQRLIRSKALEHPQISYWACLVLAEIGPQAKDAVPHLKEVLQHEDPEVRLQGLVTLGEIGPAAKPLTPEIVAALRNDPFDGVRYAAAFALGKIGTDGEAEKALSAAAEHRDPFLRLVSAWALALNNPDNRPMVERAVNRILAAFRSDNIHLRRAAAKAAVELDVPLDKVTPLLVDALKDEDPTVVRNAVEALAEFGPQALKHIDDRLQNRDLRPYAVQLISRLGPKAESAVPALIKAIREKPQDEDDIQFLREAQFALAEIGPGAKSAVATLVDSLNSEHEQVRASAAFALGKIGPDAAGAVSTLRGKLRDPSPIVRLASIRALLEIQPGERRLAMIAAPMLIKALDSEHELVRAEAATALGEIGARAARSRIQTLTKDDSELVREAATEALKKLGG